MKAFMLTKNHTFNGTGGIWAEQWHLLWTNLYNTIIHVKATSSNCSSTSQKTGVLK
jgi:hypothetical protein